MPGLFAFAVDSVLRIWNFGIMETDFNQRLSELECRVARLEAREESQSPTNATYNIVDAVKNNEELVDGAVMFGGTVNVGPYHYEYQWARPTHWVTDNAWEDPISRINALAHPVRGEILRRLLAAPATVTELVEENIVSSTGTAYHHINALHAAGWVSKFDGGYEIPPARVIPLMTIVIASEAH